MISQMEPAHESLPGAAVCGFQSEGFVAAPGAGTDVGHGIPERRDVTWGGGGGEGWWDVENQTKASLTREAASSLSLFYPHLARSPFEVSCPHGSVPSMAHDRDRDRDGGGVYRQSHCSSPTVWLPK